MARQRHAHIAFAFVIAGFAAITACGGKAAGPLSPSAPSATTAAATPTPAPAPPAPAPSVSGATISGTVSGAGVSSRRKDVSGTSSGLSVRVAGTTLETQVDTVGRFTLTGVPAGNVELEFTSASIDARLQLNNVNDREKIEIRVVLNGNTAAIDADQRVEDNDQAEVSGPISGINVGARTFSVGSATINVPVGVDIQNGGNSIRFEDLREQERVEVEGVNQGGVIVASRVQVEDAAHEPEPPESEPHPDDAQMDFSGAVAGLAGSCPSVSFTIGVTPVRAGSATDFSGGGCSALRNGLTVEVKGRAQGDGSVLASQIKIDK